MGLGDDAGELLRQRSVAIERPSPNEASLMAGEIVHHGLFDGIWAHYCDAQEVQDSRFSFWLPAGVSVTVLFEGALDFAIGGRRCQLRARRSSPQMMLYLLHEQDLLTRRVSNGQRVHKVNLYIPWDWLQARSSSADEYLSLLRHGEHGEVYRGAVSSELLAVARKFAQRMQAPNSLRATLRREGAGVAFFDGALDWLRQRLAPAACAGQALAGAATSTRATSHREFVRTVDRLLRASPRSTLDTIAREVHMSSKTLTRRCQQELGMTPAELIRSYRLENAKDALITGGVRVSEAAEIAGYRQASTFSTAFKKRFSMTPTQMVSAHRG